MKISVNAKELVNMILMLSKVHNKSDKIRSILLKNDDGTKCSLHSSGTFGISRGIVNAVLEDGYSEITGNDAVFIPTSVIPFLQIMGDTNINFTVDESEVKINKKVTIRQINHIDGIVTEPDEIPEWSEVDLSRLGDIIYAADTNVVSGYDVIFFNEDSIITTDRFRMAVYKPNGFHIDEPLVVRTGTVSLVNSDSIRIGIGDKSVRVGNDILYTTIEKAVTPPPTVIINLISNPIENYITITKDDFVKNIKLAKNILDKDRPVCNLSVANNKLTVFAKSEKGEAIPEQDIYETVGNFELNSNFDVFYLLDITNTLKHTNINLAIVNRMLCIVDGDVLHYILPRA
jgi:hypothetical protein